MASEQQPNPANPSRHRTTTRVSLGVPGVDRRPKTPDTFEREFNTFFRNKNVDLLGGSVHEHLNPTEPASAFQFDPFSFEPQSPHFKDFHQPAFNDVHNNLYWDRHSRDIPIPVIRSNRHSYGPSELHNAQNHPESNTGFYSPQLPNSRRSEPAFVKESESKQQADPTWQQTGAEQPKVYRMPPQPKQYQYHHQPDPNFRSQSPNQRPEQHSGQGSPRSSHEPFPPRHVHFATNDQPQSPLTQKTGPKQVYKFPGALNQGRSGSDQGLFRSSAVNNNLSQSHDDLRGPDNENGTYSKHGPAFTLFQINDPNIEISEEFPNRERHRKLSRQASLPKEQPPQQQQLQQQQQQPVFNEAENGLKQHEQDLCPDWQASVQTASFHKRHLAVTKQGHLIFVSAKKTVESLQMGRQEITKQWQVVAPETVNMGSVRVKYTDDQQKLVITGFFDQVSQLEIEEN